MLSAASSIPCFESERANTESYVRTCHNAGVKFREREARLFHGSELSALYTIHTFSSVSGQVPESKYSYSNQQGTRSSMRSREELQRGVCVHCASDQKIGELGRQISLCHHESCTEAA